MDFPKTFDDLVKFLTVRLVLGGAVLFATIVALVTLICHVAGWAEIPLWAMAIGAVVGAMAGILSILAILPGILIATMVVGLIIAWLHQ